MDGVNMKKTILTVSILLMALMSANAAIFVAWNLATSLSAHGTTLPDTMGNTATAAWQAGDSVLWGLVWSSSDVLSPVDYEAFYDVANGTDDAGNLELLATRTVNTTVGADFGEVTAWAKDGASENSAGGHLTQWLRQSGSIDYEFDGRALSYASGYLYQVVFVENAAGYSYFISNAFDFDETLSSDQATPEVFRLTSTQGVMQGQHQAIPEPTTMALLGMGGLALALRRKLRK